MTRRSLFTVEVRFYGARAWRSHVRLGRLDRALARAQALAALRAAEGTGDVWAFPHVRIRYRGVTLCLWRWGCCEG